jgi:small subunit ribosomal protein S4e
MSGHMKRVAAPKVIRVRKKAGKFLTKTAPGPHPKEKSIPLGVLVRDVLGIASNSRETKKIMVGSKVLVDCVPRKEMKFPVGFMDTVEFGKNNYRITLDRKGKIAPIKISKKESNMKIVMITRKTAVRGKRTQLTMHDGRNMLFSLTEGKKYKRGASFIISLPEQKIIGYIPYEKDSQVFIISGRHVGQEAKVLEISGEKVLLKGEKGEEFETLGDYAVPISKEVTVK